MPGPVPFVFEWDPMKARANRGEHGVDFAEAMAAIGRRAMIDEYHFSKAERGRFSRSDAALTPPVHLDPDVPHFLSARASARGISSSDLVNTMLKKDIELIEAVV